MRADGREYTCVASNKFGSKVTFALNCVASDLNFAFSALFFFFPIQLISVLCLGSSAFFLTHYSMALADYFHAGFPRMLENFFNVEAIASNIH